MWLSFSVHCGIGEKECSGVDTNRTWLHLILLYHHGHKVSWWVTGASWYLNCCSVCLPFFFIILVKARKPHSKTALWSVTSDSSLVFHITYFQMTKTKQDWQSFFLFYTHKETQMDCSIDLNTKNSTRGVFIIITADSESNGWASW